MTNPNPFVPKGSLLEQQSQRRSRLKLAVSCVLVVSITGLVAMLGCKREQPPVDNPSPLDNPTNNLSLDNTNLVTPPTNTVVPPLPPLPPPTNTVVPPLPPVPNAGETAGATEYLVQAGDSFSKLSKKFNVSVHAIEAANPGVDSKKLKIKQKLNIPAGGKTGAGGLAPVATAGGVPDADGESYTVKSGDTLEKLHKKFGVSVKAIQAANSLTTTKIRVGQKLKLPAKAEAAPVAPATVPPVDTAPLPSVTPASAPSAPASH